MPDQPGASGAFRRPFREQVAFFRGKLGNLVPTSRWDDIERSAHDRAFMVAGAQKADLLADLAAAVDRAIVDGKSLDAFRKDFNAAVERNDWHGWTGETTKAGRAWRTRTIYRTNASVSYAAGRRAQLEAAGYPLWVYRHGGSEDFRPEHLELDGLVLTSDDPAWAWLYPPSDWGCSCYVVGARSERGARRVGGKPDKPRPAWFGQIDAQTGAPVGVGKGWDYAPGASVADAVNAAARKVGSMDYQIGKAFMDDVPPTLRDALADAYRRLPSVEDDLRRYAQRVTGSTKDDLDAGGVPEVKTIGPLTSAQATRIDALTGVDATGFDFTIARSQIGHVEGRHGIDAERDRSQRPVAAADYARLPGLIASNPIEKAGTTSNGLPAVRISGLIAGERYELVFEVRGKRRRTLTLLTFYIKRKKG